MAAFNSQTAPDVLELGSDWVAQFSSSGVLRELFDTLLIEKSVEFSRQPALWKGKIFALPWTVDTRVMFYNKSLMQRAGLPADPPVTLDQLLDYSEKINNLGDVNGFGINGSDPHRLYKKILGFMWTFGGDVMDPQMLPVMQSSNNLKAFNYYLMLSSYGIIETQRQLDAYFTQGKIGFCISGGWLLEKIQKENPTLEFGVALMPGMNGKPGMSFAGGEYLAVNAATQKSELAKEFIRFMTDGKNTLKYCKQVVEAGFPADRNYYNDPFYQTNPLRIIIAKQLEYAKMTPVHPKWLDIEEILENAVMETLLAKKSSEKALEDAQSAMESLLKK
jgi:multiple sugar transport system substrate-binding protein